MIKLSKGQTLVLVATSLPMAAVGTAGAVATYINMDNVLHRSGSALGLVAAGEGATLVCALVALLVTLMGQHTPAVVRAGLWLIPVLASATGVALAPTQDERVVMAVTPLAMTAAGEGIAFVARRVVAYRTGTDIEQQRRSGLLLWHANRAANGSGIGRRLSKAAVWRLTRSFAATDSQLSVQLGEIQRFRIQQGADANLAAVLNGTPRTGKGTGLSNALEGAYGNGTPQPKPTPPAPLPEAVQTAVAALEAPEAPTGLGLAGAVRALADRDAERSGALDHIRSEVSGIEEAVIADPGVALLTYADIVALKGCKPETARSWVRRGKLPVHSTVDGRPRFHPKDVAEMPGING